jgi:hypothetical protein
MEVIRLASLGGCSGEERASSSPSTYSSVLDTLGGGIVLGRYV